MHDFLLSTTFLLFMLSVIGIIYTDINSEIFIFYITVVCLIITTVWLKCHILQNIQHCIILLRD